MGKMEAAGEIINRLAVNGWTAPQANSSETLKERKALIERQIRRMHLSANQEPPAPERLRLMVEDALRLWKSIPSERLSEAVEAGIIQAGNFLATAGGVAKAWQERRPKELVMDYVALGLRDAALALPDPSPKFSEVSEEEKKETQRKMYEAIGMPIPEHLK